MEIARRIQPLSVPLRIFGGEIANYEPILCSESVSHNNSTVEKILLAIEEKSRRQIASRIFAFAIDKEEISGWKEDLTRALHLFSVRSNSFHLDGLVF